MQRLEPFVAFRVCHAPQSATLYRARRCSAGLISTDALNQAQRLLDFVLFLRSVGCAALLVRPISRPRRALADLHRRAVACDPFVIRCGPFAWAFVDRERLTFANRVLAPKRL